jgi:hypothetical protein
LSAQRRSQRKPLSKALRFEVFKRDKFACQYCGAKAPEVLLQVDHIKPVAHGGLDEIMNLVTSCAPCNGGKGARELSDDTAVEKARGQAEELQKRREQLEMMMQWHDGLSSIGDEAVDAVIGAYRRCVPGWTLEHAGRAKVQKMIRQAGVDEVLQCLRTASDNVVLKSDGTATRESADILLETWERAVKYARLRREDPVGSQLRYFRGILRNRISYCPERRILSLLQDAYDAGITLPVLKSTCLEARTFTSWEYEVEELIKGALHGREALL